MTEKKLIGMAGVLAVLAGIAIMQHGDIRTASETGSSQTLFQGLELNAIDGIDIFQGSENGRAGEAVSLIKKEGAWIVDSLYSYPVDFGKLADALHAAAAVKTGRPLRSGNVDPTEYGFDDAKTVELKRADKEAMQLEIGAQREASDAAGWASEHFIRRNGSENVYLVDYDFRLFSTNPDDWIDTGLLNVSASEIVSVTVGDVELKEMEGQWTLVDLDEQTEELQTSEANSLRSALQYLTCTSVADPDAAFTNVAVYTASTTNQTYTVTVGGKTDGGRLIRLAGDVPEKLKGWTYVVSSYKADHFLVDRKKLVQDKKESVENKD